MGWASWTTVAVFAGRGGVLTQEGVTLGGELDIHTTWAEGHADVAVQYRGGSEWLVMAGSPAPCPSEEASRGLHDAVVEAVRRGNAATVPAPAPVSG
ncbi:hypothetical protein ABZY31_10320 [Streptomyces sp. NPDC006529]|uniref:hypothetical protein n=1 Tax=Streptomyces sp. NPDC006529 TaxID=3157177 RepID=UPI0033ADE2E1